MKYTVPLFKCLPFDTYVPFYRSSYLCMYLHQKRRTIICSRHVPESRSRGSRGRHRGGLHKLQARTLEGQKLPSMRRIAS